MGINWSLKLFLKELRTVKFGEMNVNLIIVMKIGTVINKLKKMRGKMKIHLKII